MPTWQENEREKVGMRFRRQWANISMDNGPFQSLNFLSPSIVQPTHLPIVMPPIRRNKQSASPGVYSRCIGVLLLIVTPFQWRLPPHIISTTFLSLQTSRCRRDPQLQRLMSSLMALHRHQSRSGLMVRRGHQDTYRGHRMLSSSSARKYPWC
jgi:hypothetical protein